jgi:hypothetical protein
MHNGLYGKVSIVHVREALTSFGEEGNLFPDHLKWGSGGGVPPVALPVAIEIGRPTSVG